MTPRPHITIDYRRTMGGWIYKVRSHGRKVAEGYWPTVAVAQLYAELAARQCVRAEAATEYARRFAGAIAVTFAPFAAACQRAQDAIINFGITLSKGVQK